MEGTPIKSGTDGGPPRIAIKLSSHERKGGSQDQNIINRVLESVVPGITQATQIQPLILSQKPETVAALVARAVRMDPDYKPVDFSAWYQLHIKPSQFKDPSGGKNFDFARQAHVEEFVRRLNELNEIESAHSLHLPPPPAVNPADDPREKNENYHAAAPLGIDIRYIWGLNLPGGDGAGIGFVDMEQGWNLNHEDLKDAAITIISGDNHIGNGSFNYRGHGTSVLGEVCMVDNVNIGGVGIAPSCTARVISLWTSTTANRSDSDTIIDAVAHMAYGDVLLLEAQAYDSRTGTTSGSPTYPVEINDDTFEAIRLATAVGIVVVEAGANGSINLDTYTHSSTGKQYLNRTSSDFRDSGAIMVGAASSTVPHNRLGFSSYGSRIDLYAWGENVDTATTDYTGTVNTGYTSGFNGTSSASPIITGAAIVVQGIAEANFGFRFPPLELRRILAINGTASSNPATDLIGVMPDLRAIVDGHFVNLAPDVFLRDYVGDNGDPTSGAISASPDIIVRQSPVTNPQGAFGQGSGTENDPTLSQDVLAGRDHAIYVRVANRGGSTATDVSVNVYYAIGATLQQPSRWTLIGTTIVPSVPTGRTLVASDEILWRAAAVPGPGHYCFIAVAGSASEPAPVRPDDLGSWDNWLKFVENNNNVAWRNFNVISAPNNRNAKDPHQFSFEIPGAFDVARSFSIETLGSLPRGSSVQLRVPLTLARQLRIKVQESQVKEKVAVLPLPAFARYVVGSGMLPPGSIAQCNILVYVPEATYKQPGTFEFAIRQLYGEFEVGRITWHFGQPTEVKAKECKV